MSGPGVKGAGDTVKAVAHVMDLAPTFLEIAGASYPNTFQGREVVPLLGESLVPVLAGMSNTVRGDDDPLGFEMMGWKSH